MKYAPGQTIGRIEGLQAKKYEIMFKGEQVSELYITDTAEAKEINSLLEEITPRLGFIFSIGVEHIYINSHPTRKYQFEIFEELLDKINASLFCDLYEIYIGEELVDLLEIPNYKVGIKTRKWLKENSPEYKIVKDGKSLSIVIPYDENVDKEAMLKKLSCLSLVS